MTFWFWGVVRIIANPFANVFQKLLVRARRNRKRLAGSLVVRNAG